MKAKHVRRESGVAVVRSVRRAGRRRATAGGEAKPALRPSPFLVHALQLRARKLEA